MLPFDGVLTGNHMFELYTKNAAGSTVSGPFYFHVALRSVTGHRVALREKGIVSDLWSAIVA